MGFWASAWDCGNCASSSRARIATPRESHPVRSEQTTLWAVTVTVKYGEKKLTHARKKRNIGVLPSLFTRTGRKRKVPSFGNSSIPVQRRSDDSTGTV